MNYRRIVHGVGGQMRILIHSGYRRIMHGVRRRELILRNLPSNTMRYSTIIHSKEKYFDSNMIHNEILT